MRILTTVFLLTTQKSKAKTTFSWTTNALSDAVAALLKAGMGSSAKVRDYFAKLYDPNLGDRVALAFRGEYESLRNAKLAPDNIFARLQLIGNGTTLATPSRQAATLTVLAYLFEECDIFERPPEETQT